MFKKIISVISVLFVTLSFIGCQNNSVTVPDKVNVNQGITHNKIEFKVLLANEYSLSTIEPIKNKRGFKIIKEDNNYTYIFIGLGEKMTGGYSVKVNGVEDIEGSTNILIQETSPAKDAIVMQAINYPYSVVRIDKNTAPKFNIIIENKKAEKISEL